MDQLPEYMKQCFLTLYNSIDEIASDALSNHGVDVMPYLKKVVWSHSENFRFSNELKYIILLSKLLSQNLMVQWLDLCKSYLLESNWYHSGYRPTMQEYIDNAWISVAGPIMLVHSYVFVSPQITKVELERLTEYPDIIRWSSTIMRLANDLLTPLVRE